MFLTFKDILALIGVTFFIGVFVGVALDWFINVKK